MKNVIVLIGAGQIGQAIARRVCVGKHVLLAYQLSKRGTPLANDELNGAVGRF